MITMGTVKEIRPTSKAYKVVLTKASYAEVNCETKNIEGFKVGSYVAVGGRQNGNTLKNALLIPYTPTKNYLTEPQYKPLWSR